MEEHLIFKGILTIDKQILKIENKYITIPQIASMDVVKLKRYPLFSGLRLWFKGLVFLVILTLFYHNNSILSFVGDLYCYSIFILLGYNLFQHCKLFYGLAIVASGEKTIICSRKESFIYDIQNALYSAMNSIRDTKTINLNHCVINDGIISYGNDNENEVHL